MRIDEASYLSQQPPDTDHAFEDFLKAEYDTISQAHFNTIQSISEFFKVYIGIVSLPISVAVIFLKPVCGELLVFAENSSGAQSCESPTCD